MVWAHFTVDRMVFARVSICAAEHTTEICHADLFFCNAPREQDADLIYPPLLMLGHRSAGMLGDRSAGTLSASSFGVRGEFQTQPGSMHP